MTLQWTTGGLDSCASTVASLDRQQQAEFGAWAIGVVCTNVKEPPPPVLELLELAGDRLRWSAAHDVFDRIREVTLKRESALWPGGGANTRILYVAENAAQLLYNATDPVDPFDGDSCASSLYSIVDFSAALRKDSRTKLLEAVDAHLLELQQAPPTPRD